MMKKNKMCLGRALIRDRRQKGLQSDCFRHTTELKDGCDWSSNMQSITERNDLDEFLATAELAGVNFATEKMNIRVVTNETQHRLLSESENKTQQELFLRHKDSIRVPRRPYWNDRTTAEELAANERESFLIWRRELANLQENEGINMTPYEKNLEFWRQLWRVVERSDVVVQIVDARNPLLFFCEDLFAYVREVSPHKRCLVMLNKADFLTHVQRQAWADYFRNRQDKLKVVFFSALDNPDTGDEADEVAAEILNLSVDEYSSAILTRDQLVELFRTWHTAPKIQPGRSTVGLCGYPNVGKSSTINAIAKSKKVSVSSTPGKTKHFQTLHLREDLIVCDCPGLVFPNFVSSKAEMVLNGILPVDQLRDHVPPMNLLLSMIPRHVLEDTYGICIPAPPEGDDSTRPPTSFEFLNAYSYARGFMTVSGQPDHPRGARYVLKDFVNGKLKHCIAPPTVKQSEYHTYPPSKRSTPSTSIPVHVRMMKERVSTTEDIDRDFFNKQSVGVAFKGRHLIKSGLTTNCEITIGDKKHYNGRKREKLRRLHQHKDL